MLECLCCRGLPSGLSFVGLAAPCAVASLVQPPTRDIDKGSQGSGPLGASTSKHFKTQTCL